MKNEYNTEVIMERIGQKTTRWIENEESINENMSSSRSILVKDLYDNYVFLFENDLVNFNIKRVSQSFLEMLFNFLIISMY